MSELSALAYVALMVCVIGVYMGLIVYTCSTVWYIIVNFQKDGTISLWELAKFFLALTLLFGVSIDIKIG
jgi:hypothetical protein